MIYDIPVKRDPRMPARFVWMPIEREVKLDKIAVIVIVWRRGQVGFKQRTDRCKWFLSRYGQHFPRRMWGEIGGNLKWFREVKVSFLGR